MARNFKELIDKMSPARQARIKRGADRMRAEMALAIVIERRGFRETTPARTIFVGQFPETPPNVH